MTYDAQETSVESARPVELFRFSNLFETFLYTSGRTPITVGPETYEPNAISREAAEIGTQQVNSGGLVITLPITDPFALRYTTTVPASADKLEVFRLHASDTPAPEVRKIWQGDVSSVAFEGDEAKVRVSPGASILNRVIPRRTCANPCGHVLYDRGCGVSDADPSFRFDVTVGAINGVQIDVSAAGLSALAADFFVAGFLERTAVLDYRMVLAQTDLGGDTLRLDLLLPFNDVSVGDALVLRAGCDHIFTTCVTKFNNGDRHGGFPFVPEKNLFETGIIDD